MTKRQIIISLSAVAFIALSVVIARSMNREKIAPPNKMDLGTAVKTQILTPDEVSRSIKITGRLIPSQSVSLFAEVGGVAQFTTRPFKEGTRFSRGDVLLRINSDEIESVLIAGRSNFQSLLASVIPDLKLDFKDYADEWEDYLYEMEINKKLPPLPQNEDKKLKLFLSGRQVYSSYYNLMEQESRLEKFTLRAPFSGSIVRANIDDGSLVRVGQALGEFISTGNYELEAGVSYSELGTISIGTEFEMQDVNTKKAFRAKVVRINDQVDIESQQVLIYARILDETAKSGVYLEGYIPVEQYNNAIEIPIEALIDDAYVFAVEDSMAVLKSVSIAFKNNEIAILQGIESKTEVIISKHNQSLKGKKVSPVNFNE
jgi:multidrug efflux pump subunit AcrA (membrane-fusion protein)